MMWLGYGVVGCIETVERQRVEMVADCTTKGGVILDRTYTYGRGQTGHNFTCIECGQVRNSGTLKTEGCMKPLELDSKGTDYLRLMEAAQLVRNHWVSHAGDVEAADICILQAWAVVTDFAKADFAFSKPPEELVDLCWLRNQDYKMPIGFLLPWFRDVDCVWLYNDRVCESAEEAATILEQAADLVLQRDEK